VETGWEDAPYFNIGFPCACPGLNASLALQMEAVAKLGKEIGRPEEEYALWMKRSEELTKKIVEKFWDGERWFAFNAETGKKSDSNTISLYTALFLGKRLPRRSSTSALRICTARTVRYALRPRSEAEQQIIQTLFYKRQHHHAAQFLMALSLEAAARRSGKRRSE
jgi:hypothetical protein